MKKDTIAYLEKFIKAVKKKYGEDALNFRVEVHGQYVVDGEEHWGPNELSFVGVAKYKADKDNDIPSERVLVIR